MIVKKILGIIFIILASLLTITFVTQMPKLIITTGGFIKLFTGTFDGYEFGRLLAVVLISFIHLGITYVLWKYGLKWVKPKAKQNTSYE